MYRMDTVLCLILLVSEMLKIPRAKVECHSLNKLAVFGTTLENVQGQQRTFQNTQQYANNFVHTFSYYLVYSANLS